MGTDDAVVVNTSGALELEKLLHGDVVDAESVDYVARFIGKSQFEQMRNAQELEGYQPMGAIVGLAEQCIVLGIMFERERLRLLRGGRVEAKPRDHEDGHAS